MDYRDVQDCCNADARTNVLANVPGFTGKCDVMTVEDATRMTEEEEYVGSMEEKIANDTFHDH